MFDSPNVQRFIMANWVKNIYIYSKELLRKNGEWDERRERRKEEEQKKQKSESN